MSQYQEYHCTSQILTNNPKKHKFIHNGLHSATGTQRALTGFNLLHIKSPYLISSNPHCNLQFVSSGYGPRGLLACNE